jgi:hypothetical protein
LVYVKREEAFRAIIEAHEYHYLVPGEGDYLAWAVDKGLVPRLPLLSEVHRALEEGAEGPLKAELEALERRLAPSGRPTAGAKPRGRARCLLCYDMKGDLDPRPQWRITIP